jgi:hypothetical protein
MSAMLTRQHPCKCPPYLQVSSILLYINICSIACAPLLRPAETLSSPSQLEQAARSHTATSPSSRCGLCSRLFAARRTSRGRPTSSPPRPAPSPGGDQHAGGGPCPPQPPACLGAPSAHRRLQPRQRGVDLERPRHAPPACPRAARHHRRLRPRSRGVFLERSGWVAPRPRPRKCDDVINIGKTDDSAIRFPQPRGHRAWLTC